MATSLFDFLLETMPLAGARCALEANSSGRTKFEDFTPSELRRLFRYLPGDQDYVAALPPVGVTAFDKEQPEQGLWGWTHRGGSPAKITDVFCRVRDAKYSAFKVLDSIEWGLEDPVGSFRNAIRVTNSSGLAIELPLTPRFVHWKWVAVAGYLPDDATPLWRLKALHDRSLVVAFVYDLDPTTGEPKPMRETAESDAERAAELEKLEKAARELTPEGAKADGGASDDGPACTDEETWVARIRKDNFMDKEAAQNEVQGEVGEQCKAMTGAPRILVTLCLTVCRERSDFEPGGVVGTGRLYPHVMVWANIPLTKLEASIRFDRPSQTTKVRESLPASGHDCCKGHDAMPLEIGSILVTDANKDESKIPGPTLPFFPNMFAYYEFDPVKRFSQTPIRMVRTDRPRARSNDSGWIVRDVVGGSKSTVVAKEARQGAFDNIHLAPKMKLVGVSKVAFSYNPSAMEYEPKFPVDRAKLRIDDISMAPFCAHDCYHTHWRWGKAAKAKWTLGWDETGPYKVPGAPMVPLNQDVSIWLRSGNAYTYHVTVTPKAGSSFIPPGECQVLMYHGGAYAVAVTGVLEIFVARTVFLHLAPPPYFFDDAGFLVEPRDSWSLMYWYERFAAGPSNTIVERTTITDDGLRKAMDL